MLLVVYVLSSQFSAILFLSRLCYVLLSVNSVVVHIQCFSLTNHVDNWMNVLCPHLTLDPHIIIHLLLVLNLTAFTVVRDCLVSSPPFSCLWFLNAKENKTEMTHLTFLCAKSFSSVTSYFMWMISLIPAILSHPFTDANSMRANISVLHVVMDRAPQQVRETHSTMNLSSKSKTQYGTLSHDNVTFSFPA